MFFKCTIFFYLRTSQICHESLLPQPAGVCVVPVCRSDTQPVTECSMLHFFTNSPDPAASGSASRLLNRKGQQGGAALTGRETRAETTEQAGGAEDCREVQLFEDAVLLHRGKTFTQVLRSQLFCLSVWSRQIRHQREAL